MRYSLIVPVYNRPDEVDELLASLCVQTCRDFDVHIVEDGSSVTVKVTNTGKNAAKHSVQLYVSVPYTDYDRENGIEKAAVELSMVRSR